MIAVFGSTGGLGSVISDHLNADERFSSKHADLRDESAILALFRGLASRHQDTEPWHIVNATGSCHNSKIETGTYLSFMEDVKTNLGGSLLLLKAVAPYLETRPDSSVTLLSSVTAYVGVYGASSYTSSKAALGGLVRSACIEFAKYRCRVNVLELGYFDAGMITKVPESAQKALVDSIPLHRFGNPTEAAIACEFAICCGYMNGAVVRINGGLI